MARGDRGPMDAMSVYCQATADNPSCDREITRSAVAQSILRTPSSGCQPISRRSGVGIRDPPDRVDSQDPPTKPMGTCTLWVQYHTKRDQTVRVEASARRQASLSSLRSLTVRLQGRLTVPDRPSPTTLVKVDRRAALVIAALGDSSEIH